MSDPTTDRYEPSTQRASDSVADNFGDDVAVQEMDAPENEAGGVEAADSSSEPIVRDPTKYYDLDDTPWLSSIWRPTLITIAAGCLVVAFLAFMQRLVPDLSNSYRWVATTLGLFSAIVGCVTTTYMAQPGRRSDRQSGYRAAEFIFLIVITRLTTWAVIGNWPDIELLLRPMESLFDVYFIVALVGVIMAWIMASSMTDDMINMGLRPDDIYMARGYNDQWQDTARPVYTDRPAILRRFTGRWVGGGLLIVVFAAGSRFAMPEPGFYLPIINQGMDPAVIVSAIIYFLVGLALISQGQLALLRARWALQKTPTSSSILRRWPVYAFGLILIIGIISALLPLGGTFHLALIIRAFIEGAMWLVVHFFGAILAILSFFLLLLKGEDNEPPPPTPTPEPLTQITITPSPEQPPMEIPPWAGGAVFWVIAALVIGYAAYIYFGGRGFSFAWLHQLWEMLRLRWGQMVDSVSEWQATRSRDDETPDKQGKGRRRSRLLAWLGYRGLDPDAQTRYYYLSMLEQAEDAGRPRRQYETPYQYAQRLDAELLAQTEKARRAEQEGLAEQTEPTTTVDAAAVEDANAAEDSASMSEASSASAGAGSEAAAMPPEQSSDEIQALTEAFVGVRYAQRHVDADEAGVLRKLWERTKRLLKRN